MLFFTGMGVRILQNNILWAAHILFIDHYVYTGET